MGSTLLCLSFSLFWSLQDKGGKMNCYNHPEKPAVVQCRQCGKGFCVDCANDVVDGICPSCRITNQQIWAGQRNIILKEQQKWHRTGLLWIVGGAAVDILILATSMPEYLGFGSAIGIFVFLFRYTRRLIHSLLGRMAPKGGGCLVNPLIVFLIELFAFIPIGMVSPILLIYSIARAFGLKKGISDYITWI